MSDDNMMGAVLQRGATNVAVECNDWRDQANSDPIADMFKAVQEFIEKHGTDPAHLWVTIETHHALLRHPLLLDRIWNHRELRVLSRTDLAAIFDVQKYVVEGDL